MFDAMEGVLNAIEAAPTARRWAATLVRFEMLALTELGFGLDLTHCAGGGDAKDLVWVSPKSGIGVSKAAGETHRAKLLPLPAFIMAGGEGTSWEEIFEGFELTGHFVARDLLAERRNNVMAARERLIERLRRAV
jgi:DNA repair protein RecO (recombination protein O)